MCIGNQLKNQRKGEKLLPLQSAQVSVSESNSSGKISYLDGLVSGERGSYEVIMDYMKIQS